MTEVRPHPASTGLRDPGGTALLLTLSLVAGMVDVTSFVLLHGVFAAHITGNVVVLAADVATHRSVEATSVAAVLVFVAVTAVLTAIVDSSTRTPYRWARGFLAVQFGLLAVVAASAVALHAGGHRGSGAALVVAVLAVAAMACQNALLHLTFRYAPSTAVMTGNTVASTAALVGLAVHWSRRRLHATVAGRTPGAASTARTGASEPGDREVWQRSWPTMLGFVAGCLLGAATSEALQWWAWLVPAVVAGVLALVVTETNLPVSLRRSP